MKLASRGRRKRSSTMTTISKRKHLSPGHNFIKSDESTPSVTISPSLIDQSCALFHTDSFLNVPRTVAYTDGEHNIIISTSNTDDDDDELQQAASILFDMRRIKATPMMTLALPEDKDHLNSLHCFVRRNLLEIIVVSNCSIRPKVCYDRVGFRCVHCAHTPKGERDTGASFFPRALDDIYRMVCNWQRTHFQTCHHVPDDVKRRYWELKTQDRSRGKVPYWTDSARKIGLANYIDTVASMSSRSSSNSRKISPAGSNIIQDEEREDDDDETCMIKSKRIGIRFVQTVV